MVIANLIAQALPEGFGQRLVVENRGIIAIEIAAKSPPDGYTLLHYTNPLWLMPLFRADAGWDALRDFVPITQTLTSPNLLVVHPSLPVRSVTDLIAFAKARPGQLNYASSSTGSGNHVAAELFKAMAGVDIVRVNYKSGGQAVNDLAAGQVHVMFPAAGSAWPHVRAGRLRGLGITAAKPSALVPGMAALAQSGLPAYESSSVAALMAPAGTSSAIVQHVHAAVVRAINAPGVGERMRKAGIEGVGSTPGETAAMIKVEIARMEKVVKDGGLRE
ncbi:MAG: tripartite tricarboxylate transporter substrate binding protein [Burkholderiales bacterium]|nr:tripartite tricarboxylate transporter substrate binding protein [Burkholderiales bacterium]